MIIRTRRGARAHQAVRTAGSVLPPIARFLDRPLALHPGAETLILQMLQAEPVALYPSDAAYEPPKPYDVVDGVAIIEICGILVHDCTWWCWDETAYSTIARALRAALADPEVRAVALLINSPGGEVSGCFDLAELIYASRGDKPIWAILDDGAYSAAYALGCAADRIIVPATGGTGSIGVISMHVDVTKALDEWGVKVTTFQFGARKSDGYPTTPLSKEARERFQADVDTLGEQFVDLVARNRKLEAKAVRDTEAATFLGEAGRAAGLADAVMSPDDAFLQLVADVS